MGTNMARLVRFRVLDGIAVVTLDAPPANALSAAMRAGLWEALNRIEANDDIVGAVIMASGRLFSAGADIREFGTARKQPMLSQVCTRIETCKKPIVGAAQGQALGGGAEILLASHYRLAGPDGRIGLPEVALGLVPGAGGTQRLPRLIGAERALQMMVSANSIDAGSAHRIGLIDGIVQGDLGSGAITFAQNLISQGKGPRRTRDNRKHLADGRAYQAAVAKTRDMLRNSPLHAPERVLECVEAAALLPFEAGLAFEQDAFARCVDHPQSRALRHVFVSERKIDEALITREGATFQPVAPMGKAAVQRLRKALRAGADHLVEQGVDQAQIDSAMVAYGFRKGIFGAREDSALDPTIMRRLIAALVAEGANCVEQQAVQRPSDIDALAVHGLGLIGLRKDMRDWAQDCDVWQPPELLDEAIKVSGGFDALG